MEYVRRLIRRIDDTLHIAACDDTKDRSANWQTHLECVFQMEMTDQVGAKYLLRGNKSCSEGKA